MALTYGYQIHKRTGLKILGGGGHEFARRENL